MKARLIDFGVVSALRSQTIYHAVSECTPSDGTPTITLMRPEKPYVCIGFHQELEKEIDLAYCRQNDIPVLRRQVGGGAVLLDINQLFFHVILPKGKVDEFGLPLLLEQRYAHLARAPIAAYHKLGIEAQFRPINDIHVGGRKIGGTGTADIGGAFLFVGSMMLDFNHQLMARVLKFSDEKMRDKVHKTMEEYVTSMKRELKAPPPVDLVKKELVDAFASVYNLEFEYGMLSPQETERLEELDRKFQTEQWLNAIRLKDDPGRQVTITANVKMLESAHKAPGGLLRVTARTVDGKIDEILFSGDFTVSPSNALKEMGREFTGSTMNISELQRRIKSGHEKAKFDIPGVSTSDFEQLFSKIAIQEN